MIRSCPEPLKRFIQDCWAGEPTERPSFTEVVARLIPIVHEMGFSVKDDEEVFEEEPILPHQMTASRHNSISLSEGQRAIKFDRKLEPIHPHSVQCLCKVNNQVWAGCRNGVIRIWDASSGDFVIDIKAHKVGVYSLQFIAGFVWSGSEDGSINAFEASSKDLKAHHVSKPTKAKEEAGIRCLLPLREFSDMDAKSKSVRVLSGDNTGALIIWKVKKVAQSINYEVTYSILDRNHLQRRYLVQC